VVVVLLLPLLLVLLLRGRLLRCRRGIPSTVPSPRVTTSLSDNRFFGIISSQELHSAKAQYVLYSPSPDHLTEK